MAEVPSPSLELADFAKLSLGDAGSTAAPAELPAALPTSPLRPRRNPLRAQSNGSLRDTARQQDSAGNHAESSGHTEAEIRVLLLQIAKLHDRIYEIQELRHSSSAPLERLNTLLSSLIDQISRLSPQIDQLLSTASQPTDQAGTSSEETRLQELKAEWIKLRQRQDLLGEEMKEDGWLIRFRTTADQAEAMMDPLEKSHSALSAYTERVSSSAYEVPYTAELHDNLSVSELIRLNEAHESLKSAYVPSITKILKMMDRSLSERSTKNGESLRRYGDMVTRWTKIQRSLAQLDAKVRLVLSQNRLEEGNDVEVLDDMSPESSRTGDYFGRPKSRSDGNNASSSRPIPKSPSQETSPTSRLAPPTPMLRRRTSVSFALSSATTRPTPDKPRWNISTRVDRSPADSPDNRRISTFGFTGRTSLAGRAVSPTPSSMSGMTSISRNVPRQSGQPGGRSGIPVATPSRVTPGSSIVTPPKRNQQYRAPYTTQATRLSLPRSTTSPAPLVQSMTAPRTRALRGPPSSYRSITPSPFPPNTPSRSSLGAPGSGATVSRPSSRLSLAGSAIGYTPSSARGPPQNLKPFQPSPYDHLDQTISSILNEAEFDLFVSRLDPSLKKGQRRAEGEEWKGEFVFGAGERSSSVKLLSIAGPKGKKTRCLVKKGGMWVDLKELLRERKEKAGEVF